MTCGCAAPQVKHLEEWTECAQYVTDAGVVCAPDAWSRSILAEGKYHDLAVPENT